MVSRVTGVFFSVSRVSAQTPPGFCTYFDLLCYGTRGPLSFLTPALKALEMRLCTPVNIVVENIKFVPNNGPMGLRLDKPKRKNLRQTMQMYRVLRRASGSETSKTQRRT